MDQIKNKESEKSEKSEKSTEISNLVEYNLRLYNDCTTHKQKNNIKEIDCEKFYNNFIRNFGYN